jgi:hypothetical protein
LNVFKKRIDAPIWFVRKDTHKVKEILSRDTQRKD